MLTKYDKDNIESLYASGMNPEDIAEHLDLDETEVVEFCSNLLMN